MKRYILLTDDKGDMLSVMGCLVRCNYNFEYRGSSRSLIVEVSDTDRPFFMEWMDIFEIRVEEFKA